MSRHPARLATALALALASAMAIASAVPRIEQQLSAAQLHATGLDTLTPAQLDALNDVLEQRDAATQARATVAATEAANTAAQARAAEPGRAQDGNGPLSPASYIGLADAPIKSTLVGSVAGWAPGTEFRLANGQVWKVLKGSMTLRKPMQAPEVVVIPGFAGRWFLQVDEDLPKARVYRTD